MHTTSAARGTDQTARQLLAVALMVPALWALTYSYVRPTAWTMVTAFQSRRLLNREPEWVGLANLRSIVEAGWFADAGYALSYAVGPVAALATLAPLLGWLAGRSGAGGRRIVLIALAVPLAGFIPVAAAAAWRHATATAGDAGAGVLGSDPRIGYWLFAGIIAVAATSTAALLAQPRGGEPDGRRWPATAILLAVAALAAIALALQEFTFPLVAAAPGGSATDVRARGPAAVMVRATTIRLDLGDGAAAAAALLVPVLALGFAAALLIVFGRLRVRVQMGDDDDRPRWWAIAGADVILLALAAGFGYLVWTVIAAWGGPPGASPGDPSSHLISEWAQLPHTVLGVGFAAAAGLAIGALRPLGRHSELLLLIFAPWLFVGTTPLLVASFADTVGRIGTPAAVTAPSWLSVPAVFIFTLFFAGLHRQWGRLRRHGVGRQAAARATYVRFGLPAVLVVAVAVWLVRAQALTWPLVAGHGQVATAATLAAQTIPPQRPWLAPLLVPAAVALVAFVAAHLHLTRRLSLHAGNSRQVDRQEC